MSLQKYKLTDCDKKTINNALKIIKQKYDSKTGLKNNLLSIIDELIYIVNSKDDEIKALEFDMQENYRPIPNSNREYPYDY